MNIEAVAEGEVLALAEMGRDVFAVDVGGGLVRHQHHDHVRLPGGLRGVEDGQALAGRLFAR